MAENDKKVSAMVAAQAMTQGALFYIAGEDQESATGYESLKIEAGQVASIMLGQFSFPLLFNTTSKNAIGAINELKGTEITGTLTAGNTSLTLSDASITTSSTIDIYTDTYGINPESVSVSTGSITLTFEEQSNDLGVKVVVK